MPTTAKIRIEALGGRRVIQALNGIRRALQGTNRTARNESRRTRQATETDARERIRAEESAAQRGADAATRAERRKRTEIRATEREREKSDRAERTRERRARRQRRTGGGGGGDEGGARGRLRNIGGAIGGGALGGLRALHGVAGNIQGAFGIRSQLEILGNAVDMRQEFIRQALAGGVRSDQVQGLIERASDVSRRTGVSPEDVLGGLNIAQERFSAIDTAVRGGDRGMNELFQNMEFFARVTRATGSSMEDVIGAAGEFQRQFGLDAEGTRRAMEIVAEGALAGSLSMRDFANRFPAAIANFQAARGVSGIEGLREFQATAQALRASGLDPRVARTMQQNLFATLANKRVARRLRTVGINALDREGNVRSIADIVSQAADSDRAGHLSSLLPLLRNQEAANALSMLRQQELRARNGQDGALTLAERTNVDEGHGAQVISDTLAALNQDASGEIVRQRVEREAQLISKSDELIEAFGRLSGTITELEDESPLLTQVGVPTGMGILSGAGIGAMAMKMLGMTGGGAAAAPGAGGAASSGLLGALAVPAAAVAAFLGVTLYSADTATAADEERANEAIGRQRELSNAVRTELTPEQRDALRTSALMEDVSGLGLSTAEGAQVARRTQGQAAQRIARGETLTPEQIQALARAIGREVANATREPGSGRRGEGSPGR